MISRQYFYQIDTQEQRSRFKHGVIQVNSWKADPWGAMIRIRQSAANDFNCDINQVKIISFNRV